MDWLRSILYGLISGLTEFLPVSSQAHQNVAAAVFGMESNAPLRLLLIRLACLAAVLVCCRREITKIRVQRRLAKARRRSRTLDTRSLLTHRLVKTAMVPMCLGLLLYLRASRWVTTLNYLAVVLVINGIILFVPQHIKSGNKDARTMSRFDAILIGLAGAISVIPGISRMGTVLFAASARGADKNYALSISLLLSIPALLLLMVFDVVSVFSGVEALNFWVLIKYGLTMAAAYFGSYCAITIMRSLAVKTGYSGFAYYCWGMSLFMLILYLTT